MVVPLGTNKVPLRPNNSGSVGIVTDGDVVPVYATFIFIPSKNISSIPLLKRAETLRTPAI
jgi:hypothetical protein